MTTEREMEFALTNQQEITAALRVIGDPDLSARLRRCMNARRPTALWRWLAALLPIGRLWLVSSRDDKGMVVRHARMVIINYVEPCYHSNSITTFLIRRCSLAPSRSERCP